MLRALVTICWRCGRPIHRATECCVFCGCNLAHEIAVEIEPEAPVEFPIPLAA